MPDTTTSRAPEPLLHTLPNGVRVIALPLPWLDSAAVSVFVRAGSAHETRLSSGIGHVLEHMVFKGTATRVCRQINLDAERLGADANAHTDKDHTAFHLRGLAEHAGLFVRMLGDLVRHASVPAEELERERQVILHELTEVEEDPVSAAFTLFDKACFGLHPAAQPVIGTRRNIERFSRADLLAHVQRLYSGANVIVGAAGRIDPAEILRETEAAFGDMPRGEPNIVAAPAYAGGIKTLRLAGSSQVHLVLGCAAPGLAEAAPVTTVAAAVLGEGMSSPLLDVLREQRGLAYHAAASADLLDMCGQFVVEASTSPEQLGELLTETVALLRRHAEHIDPVDLDRAQHQVAVRRLRNLERPYRRLEDAALDLFSLGRLMPPAERAERTRAVDAGQVRARFAAMLGGGLALALSGELPRGASDKARQLVGDLLH